MEMKGTYLVTEMRGTVLVGAKKYDLEKAIVIAQKSWIEKFKRGIFRKPLTKKLERYLCRTKNGNYFTVSWIDGKIRQIVPAPLDQAIALWQEMPVHNFKFEEVFTDIEEA